MVGHGVTANGVAADSAVGRALHDPAATPAERVCTQTVELLVRATGHHDDITLPAVQRGPVVGDLALDLPAEPTRLRDVRHRLGEWLTALGATEEDAFALQHAIGELLTNAVEHAEADAGSAVTLTAALTADGAVEATVTDRGRWREPTREPHRGRGLAVAAQLVGTLRVTHGAAGTVAHVRQPLVRAARLLDWSHRAGRHRRLPTRSCASSSRRAATRPGYARRARWTPGRPRTPGRSCCGAAGAGPCR